MTSAHSLTAKILGAVPIELKPIAGSITLDENWSPYCQASITVPAESTAAIAALDPRGATKRVELTVTETFGRSSTVADLTTRYAGGNVALTTADLDAGPIAGYTASTWWHDFDEPGEPYRVPAVRLFNLGLRSRSINHGDATIDLQLASDEALLQDSFKTTIGFSWIPYGFTLIQLVNHYLEQAGLSPAVLSDVEAAGNVVPRPELSVVTWSDHPTQSRWDLLARLVQFYDLRLWCDEARTWHLRRATPAIAGTVALSAATNIVEAEDTIDRDENYFSGVTVHYTWNDGTQERHAWDIAYTGPNPVKAHVVEIAAPYPGPGAAARIFKTRRAMGHSIPVRALSDYRVEPGRTVTIDLPSTTLQTGPVSAVTWTYPDDEMTVRTRELVDTSTPPTIEYTPVEET